MLMLIWYGRVSGVAGIKRVRDPREWLLGLKDQDAGARRSREMEHMYIFYATWRRRKENGKM
jgi:hypothetical protein